MPLYEFKCGMCDAQTEIRCKYEEKGEKAPSCCGSVMNTVVSETTFELKGSGWTPKGVDYLT